MRCVPYPNQTQLLFMVARAPFECIPFSVARPIRTNTDAALAKASRTAYPKERGACARATRLYEPTTPLNRCFSACAERLRLLHGSRVVYLPA